MQQPPPRHMSIEVSDIRGFRTGSPREESELAVIVKAKQLCGYVLTVTDKSPKKFRFTLVSRLQNLSLNVVENLYCANLVHVRGKGDAARLEERKEYQRKAYFGLKTMAYMAMIAMEQGCLLPKQYEQVSTQAVEVLRLLKAWAKSDRERYEG